MRFKVLTTEQTNVLKIEAEVKFWFIGARWVKYTHITASDLEKVSDESLTKIYDAIQERDMGYLLPIIRQYILRQERGFEPEVLCTFEVKI